ncbi:MAG: alpha-L-arabinofuranosidase [Clostridia bacterium]|nr:alpha-L-arabinofuranosidase [Clostridia bacterium]
MVTLKINTKAKHTISPYLYMQFMEPLGVADSSVDAAWDFVENEWFPEVIDKVRELSPTMIRFGGCFASYYHWREAIGDYKKRTPMINYAWSGLYHNRVGTHEYIDFCRKIGAEPFIVANMESEGIKFWQTPKNDTVRMGTDDEAAAWVDYCNNPDNKERISNGAKQPFSVKYWQIGNETSYATVSHRDNTRHCGFTAEACLEATQRFAAAMRKADPTIKIIGWGDTHRPHDGKNWCEVMSHAEGIDILAFHHHFGSGLPDSPLTGTDYRRDAEKTWLHLMNAHKSLDTQILKMKEFCGSKRLAMTEGHFSLPGRNRNEVLSSWGAGVSYARCHNVLMRHSDKLDIATLADFFGNVWQVNALMIPTPIRAGIPYLQPVGHVMKLFRAHQGENFVDVTGGGSLDVTASRTDNKIFLHVANTDMLYGEDIEFDLGGKKIASVKTYYISEHPEVEITPCNTDVFNVKETETFDNRISIPPAAVAAVEITLA